MLKVEHLTKSYQTGSQVYPVLKDISLEVEKGEFVAVMGPSGSGKTTLLNCISCFIPYEDGSILLAGKDLSGLKEEGLAKVRNQSMGFVFQDFMLLDGLSVFENICLSPDHCEAADSSDGGKGQAYLQPVRYCKKLWRSIRRISQAGEKQRTAVARALMNQPYVILADEPTGNLDSKSCKAVIDAFLQARSEMDATIFMVTHDSYAASFCDRVIVLKDGKVHGELKRTGTRRAFMDELLNTIRELGGDSDDDE